MEALQYVFAQYSLEKRSCTQIDVVRISLEVSASIVYGVEQLLKSGDIFDLRKHLQGYHLVQSASLTLRKVIWVVSDYLLVRLVS